MTWRVTRFAADGSRCDHEPPRLQTEMTVHRQARLVEVHRRSHHRKASGELERGCPALYKRGGVLSDAKGVIPSFLATLCLVVLPCRAIGQTPDQNAVSVSVQSAAAALGPLPSVHVRRLSSKAEALSGRRQLPQRAASRDSLKNGAIIGAVVGAAAFGAVVARLCWMEQEPGGPSCLPDTLRFAAIGAVIGTGAGLAIDVARTRHRGVALRLALSF